MTGSGGGARPRDHGTLLQHVPERRQSIAPPRMIVIMIVAVVVLAGVIFAAVALSLRHGGEGCSSTGHLATESRCR
jgi:hypothetical protein